jgi:hypothetical protein
LRVSFINLLITYGFLVSVVLIPGISSARGDYYYPHTRYQYSSDYFPYRSYSRHSRFTGYPRYSGYSRHYESVNYSSLSYSAASYYRDYFYYPLSFTLGSVPSSIKVYVDDGSGLRETSTVPGIKTIAWDALKHGEFDIALDYFIQDAENNPNSGLPKVGYALSAASLGNLEVATKVMKNAFATNPEAFKINPGSLRHQHLDPKSLTLINNLIHQFSADQNSNADHAFMLSALNYLKHHYAAAKKFVTFAQQYGDNSPSATNLQQLIDRQLEHRKNDLASLIQTHN